MSHAVRERILTCEEASSAERIQRAIDELEDGGGRLVLPEMELTLDRGLALRSGVELVGQGEGTLLRKGPAKVYPLSGYHNYGMLDVPLRSAAGLSPGMTVSVHDSRSHGGFNETFATITWVDGDWVGLDHGIEMDYRADDNPELTTAHPLVFGHYVHDVALRNVRLEGNRAENETSMGGCRGGAVYFANSRDVTVEGVHERDFNGEGLSFQMCRDVRILNCRFDENSGNGLHPGAGSTNVLFEGCTGEGNEKSGFFFCVRANHITVRKCRFTGNRIGVSIGTRDCHNLIEECTIDRNQGAGVLIRKTPRPVEVHSCVVRRCTIRGNGREADEAQVAILGDAHDLILEENTFAAEHGGAGIAVDPKCRNIYLHSNQIRSCNPETDPQNESMTDERPQLEVGHGDWGETIFRHLNAGSR